MHCKNATNLMSVEVCDFHCEPNQGISEGDGDVGMQGFTPALKNCVSGEESNIQVHTPNKGMLG